jgi:hypothetical protein
MARFISSPISFISRVTHGLVTMKRKYGEIAGHWE